MTGASSGYCDSSVFCYGFRRRSARVRIRVTTAATLLAIVATPTANSSMSHLRMPGHGIRGVNDFELGSDRYWLALGAGAWLRRWLWPLTSRAWADEVLGT